MARPRIRFSPFKYPKLKTKDDNENEKEDNIEDNLNILQKSPVKAPSKPMIGKRYTSGLVHEHTLLSPPSTKKVPLNDRDDKKPLHKGTPVRKRRSKTKSDEEKHHLNYNDLMIDDSDLETNDISYKYDDYASSIGSPEKLMLTPAQLKKPINELTFHAAELQQIGNQSPSKEEEMLSPVRIDNSYSSIRSTNGKIKITSTTPDEFEDSEDEVMLVPDQNNANNMDISNDFNYSKSITVDDQSNIAINGTTRAKYEDEEEEEEEEEEDDELDAEATILKVTNFINQKRLELSNSKSKHDDDTPAEMSSINLTGITHCSSPRDTNQKPPTPSMMKNGEFKEDPFVSDDENNKNKKSNDLLLFKDKNKLKTKSFEKLNSFKVSKEKDKEYATTIHKMKNNFSKVSYRPGHYSLESKDDGISNEKQEISQMNDEIVDYQNIQIKNERKTESNENGNETSSNSNSNDKWDNEQWIKLFKYLQLYKITKNHKLFKPKKILFEFNCTVDELYTRAEILKKLIDVKKITKATKKSKVLNGKFEKSRR
ncbi:hypothetical protein CANARDRAFT_28417 [[Candida] arabinofermentans NRRL YB-2248]|uniref:Uncharacterized protein n=1 Tax=[Candida] arabinofermentans NRRL YB-2248 TaxID=983967 RepID=A0A1E4T050_9ASCO|nr:hypothetical protein CANARDRAFT_28417 [[Candida] arabinofermentans NRRL YB-2248]